MTLSWPTIIYTFGALLACSQRIRLASGAEGPRTLCKGDNFVLNEPHPEVTAHHVFVFRNGDSVASTSVRATGDLQGRLQVDSDSLVTLKNLSSSDLGTYRVEVKLSDGQHTEHIVRLVVGEPPETTDGKLTAVHDFSNETIVRLKCGTFMSLGYPPVSVSWKDPRGQTLSSTGFSELSFTLDLPVNIAVPGKYCCQLDCRGPNYCCLDNQSPLRRCAQVDVQKDQTVPEVKHRREDSVSLASFISLAQQVSAVDVIVRELNFSSLLQRVADIDVTVRELERARTDQGCSESGVSAMAQLVHRQAKCDQLDAYMDRVDAIEKSFQRDLSDIRGFAKSIQNQTNLSDQHLQLKTNLTAIRHDLADIKTSADSGISTIRNKVADIEKALDNHVRNANSTLADQRLHIEEEITRVNKTFQDALSKLQQVDDRMSKLNEQMSATDEWRAIVSDFHYQIRNNMSTMSQDVTNVKTKAEQGITTIRSQVADIENAFNNHTRSLDKTFTEHRLRYEEDMIDKNATLQHVLSKMQQLEERMAKVDRSVLKLQDRLMQTEDYRSNDSEHRNQITRDLGTVRQGLSDLKTKTDHELSKIKSQVVNIENALHVHANWSDETNSTFNSTLYSLTVGCPLLRGYKFYGKHCLKLYTTPLSYAEARKRCEDDGTHLFHLKSPEMDTPPLRVLFSTKGVLKISFLWAGADDLKTEGRFVWSDGTPVSTGSGLWDSGEPNNSKGNEDCAQIVDKPSSTFLLNDNVCSLKMNFVCQADVTTN